MIDPRIFVSYHIANAPDHDTAIATQLIADIRAAGAEVIVDSDRIPDGFYERLLKQELVRCQWLVLVQTPLALRSPRIQTSVNAALNLVKQGQMKGVLRVVTASANAMDEQEMPPMWAATHVFDASQDYPKARDKVLQEVGLTEPDDPGDVDEMRPLLHRLPVADTQLDQPVRSNAAISPSSNPDSGVFTLKVSRRAVVIALAALVATGVGSSFIWFFRSKSSTSAKLRATSVPRRVASRPIKVTSTPGDTIHERWSPTGRLLLSRSRFGATTLINGMVLIQGGDAPGVFTNESELFNPKTNTWTQTGSLHEGRSEHSATLLSNGKVLVAGGYGGNTQGFRNSAELYDPTTGTWVLTGNMSQQRTSHTATLLSDGRVLVVGGWNGGDALDSAELYDPSTGNWSPAANTTSPRINHAAARLADGKVLVAGGNFTNTSELYNPRTDTWTAAASMSVPRAGLVAILLANEQVLAVGGDTPNGKTEVAELYNPVTGKWSLTASMQYPRLRLSAVLLENDTVLVAGGDAQGTSEIYIPASRAWTSPLPINQPVQRRCDAAAALLADGRVLIAGGSDCSSKNRLVSAAIYTPV